MISLGCIWVPGMEERRRYLWINNTYILIGHTPEVSQNTAFPMVHTRLYLCLVQTFSKSSPFISTSWHQKQGQRSRGCPFKRCRRARWLSLSTVCFSFPKDIISVWCHSSPFSLRKISPKIIKPVSHCFSRQTSHESSCIGSFACDCIKTIIWDRDQTTRWFKPYSQL